jgi:hypothetical protein
VYAVAITELGKESHDVARLAADLGTTLYELKLLLSSGFPAIVTLTVDAEVAASRAAAVTRHGHRAVSCDRREVVASSGMQGIVDLRFDAHALSSGAAALPYADIVALLKATQRTEETTVREEKERKFRPGMALATGGLVLSKTTQREVVTHTESRQQVLYLFTRSGAPWILRERSARYAGLGAALAPSSLENFRTTTAELRQRAPQAVYDERLQTPRTIRGIADGSAATDLLAHLIVSDLRNCRGEGY